MDTTKGDGVGWSFEPDGNFSMASAYDNIAPSAQLRVTKDWLRIWEIKMPNRICFFIWLVMHDCIMTNVERARRNLTSNTFCAFCAAKQEDRNHQFRHCPEVKCLWSASLRPRVLDALDCLDWDMWLLANVSSDTLLGLRADWPPRFAIQLWWIWKWRNDAILMGVRFLWIRNCCGSRRRRRRLRFLLQHNLIRPRSATMKLMRSFRGRGHSLARRS